MKNNLITYYAKRAEEYESIYSKPERREELNKLKLFLQNEFKGLAVYEAACGTGYWTQFIAETAASVYACDVNEEVLNIARNKQIKNENVSYQNENIYEPYNQNKFDGLFGGFIWSHIPVKDINNFLSSAESRIKTGGKIIFIDNIYVEGSSTPIAFTDEEGNTYQLRKLKDGTEYRVLKNFPDEEFLTKIFKIRNISIEVLSWKYFWVVKYEKS